jgi:hypothetical protein
VAIDIPPGKGYFITPPMILSSVVSTEYKGRIWLLEYFPRLKTRGGLDASRGSNAPKAIVEVDDIIITDALEELSNLVNVGVGYCGFPKSVGFVVMPLNVF